MARSSDALQRVLFVCDARNEQVASGIFVVGNIKQFGEWTPNVVAMYDDGTHGDGTARDGLWSLETQIDTGAQVQYKYTNSGVKGEWVPGEEFAQRNRSFVVQPSTQAGITITDIFGK